MSIKPVLLIAPLLFSATAWAADFEHCPTPTDIKQQGGVYTADARDGESKWLGVVQASKPQAVARFQEAIFYPAHEADPSLGVLSKCTYALADGAQMDMRYRTDVNPDVAIKLEKVGNWAVKEGPFGIPYRACTDVMPGACAFSEVTENRKM